MIRRIVTVALAVFVAAALAVGAYLGYQRWQAREHVGAASADKPAAPVVDGSIPARISAQARANLGLISQPVKSSTYWRTIEVQGVVTHRPGLSDRGVIAPVTGVVTAIYSHPGETVEPDSPLVTLRLTSDSLHSSQREFYKAALEIEIVTQQKQRLAGLAESGDIAGKQIIELDNEIQRLGATVKAYRQDLVARGLSSEQIDELAKGQFVREITVRAPGEKTPQPQKIALTSADDDGAPPALPFRFEFEELTVALGQQAEAGHVLCHLADHRNLLIEGQGFMNDLPLIQQAAKEGYLIGVEFEQRPGVNWPSALQKLQIHHIENTVDTQTRTFSFHLVLENQWQIYEQGEHTGYLWRFRPGDRVRLKVAVEKLENVLVLPLAAVVRETAEAYVFRQNGDLFDRLPVHVVAEDRTHVVIANDGSVRPGSYIAQNAAASLNRVLKAQMASGQPTNVHVHADGTVHAAH